MWSIRWLGGSALRGRRLLTALLMVALLVPSGLVEAKGRKKPEPMRRADVIVALGYGHVHEARPRPGMAQRVLAAVDAWKARKGRYILFCGGYTAGHIAEAEEMKIMATALGVPPKSILLERSSMTTRQNATYAAKILRSKKMKSAFLVTHTDHLPRASKDFKKFSGLKRLEGIAADGFSPAPPALKYDEPIPEASLFDAVVIHGRSRGMDADSDGTFVDSEQATLAMTMADLYRKGYSEKPFLVWHASNSIGHITRAEAIALASVVFGFPSDRYLLAPARRFKPSGEDSSAPALAKANGWARVLAVIPRARAKQADKIVGYYAQAGIEATILLSGQAAK